MVVSGVVSFAFTAHVAGLVSVPFPGIEYSTLDHGAALHFATIATNNGHDGTIDPNPFLMPARVESLTDFSHRAVHVAAGLGKKIAKIYYGASPHHSYYNGCSTGGRQGISVASRYPRDFDGILVGAPAVNFNRLVGAAGLWATYVAANTSRAIPLPLWPVITAEILKQCDGLDGRMDGIIADPSLCSWNPDTLLCGPEDDGSTCLTRDQIDGLKKIYQPILGTNGDAIFPAYDAGAEGDIPPPPLPFVGSGVIPMPTVVRRPLLCRLNLIVTYPPTVVLNRRSGTTTRYTGIPHGRLMDFQFLMSNMRILLTLLGFLLGPTLSTGWVNSRTMAGRSSHTMVPAIRYIILSSPWCLEIH